MSANNNSGSNPSTPVTQEPVLSLNTVAQEQLNIGMDNLDITMQEGQEESVGQEGFSSSNGTTSIPSSDTNMIAVLRARLQDLSNSIALGYINGLPKKELEIKQTQANETAECIRYLEGLQAVCQPKQAATAPAVTTVSNQASAQAVHHRHHFFIPSDLPYWQWQGNEWKDSADSYESVEDLLDNFSLCITSNGLDVDQNWARLMPIRMNRDQRSWFESSLKGRDITWHEVRAIVMQNYGTQDTATEIDNKDKLLSLHMNNNESLESFADRFQRIRRAARWEDDITTATIFKRALPGTLRKEVARSLLNLPRNAQDTVGKVVAKARLVLSSNICSNETNTSELSNSRKNTAASSPSTGISFVRHSDKTSGNSNPLGVSKKSTGSGIIKKKPNQFWCNYHKKGGHTTEECREFKKLLTNHASSSAVSVSSANQSAHQAPASANFTKNICRNCTDNVQWSREHASSCRRDKTNKTTSAPTRAFRSAHMANTNGASSSSVPGSSTLDSQWNPHSDAAKNNSGSMMDIDESGYPVNHDYHYREHQHICLAG